MSYDNKPKFKGAPKTALDHQKLSLYAEKQNGGTGRPKLTFAVVNNNPRIKVYTNVEGDKPGPITATMCLRGMGLILEGLKATLKNKEPHKRSFEHKDYPFYGKERSKELKVVAVTTIGRDKEGVIFIAVTADGRPKIKFDFKAPFFMGLIDENGNPPSPAIESEMAVASFLEDHRSIQNVVLATNYKEPEPRNDNGGNGNSNWKSNNNKSGGYQGGGSSGFDDEDLAFG